MKVNAVTTISAILIAGLMAYLFYTINNDESSALATAIAGFLTLATILVGMMGVRLQDSKHNTNLRLASSLFLAVALVFHLVAALASFKVAFVIIFAGIILILYILAAYSIAKVKM